MEGAHSKTGNAKTRQDEDGTRQERGLGCHHVLFLGDDDAQHGEFQSGGSAIRGEPIPQKQELRTAIPAKNDLFTLN